MDTQVQVTGHGRERTSSAQAYSPSVDIIEQPEALTLYADLPGSSSENLSVDFENGVLHIQAKVSSRQDEKTQYLLREYGVGDFDRSFEVSEHIDPTRISAEYANGVLKLMLPRAESAKPRKIAINPS